MGSRTPRQLATRSTCRRWRSSRSPPPTCRVAVAKAAAHAPLNGRLEIAGPDRLRFDEVIRRRLDARNDPRQVVIDPQAPYFGSVPGEQSLVPLDGAQLGTIRFEDWLTHPRDAVGTAYRTPRIRGVRWRSSLWHSRKEFPA